MMKFLAKIAEKYGQTVDFTNKKTLPKKCFNNGGNDEARTRDLMRDRHAL